MTGGDDLEQLRDLLAVMAYRILGSAGETQDEAA